MRGGGVATAIGNSGDDVVDGMTEVDGHRGSSEPGGQLNDVVEIVGQRGSVDHVVHSGGHLGSVEPGRQVNTKMVGFGAVVVGGIATSGGQRGSNEPGEQSGGHRGS